MNNKQKYNLRDFPECQYRTFSDDWFKECFRIGCKANLKDKTLSKRIIKKYKINGVCDPAYIANLICLYSDWKKRLFYCYSISIKKIHNKTEYLNFVGGLE